MKVIVGFVLLVIIGLVLTTFFILKSDNKDDYVNLETDGLNAEVQDSLENGILEGAITLITGNCMPQPAETADQDDNNCNYSEGVNLEVYIREMISSKDYFMPGMSYLRSDNKPKLIKQGNTNDNGIFTVSLPAGLYSVFVEYEDEEHCFQAEGFTITKESGESTYLTIYCGVEIKPNETTNLNLDLRFASV